MEGADRFIISSAGAVWFIDIAGRGVGGADMVKVPNIFSRWIHFSIASLFLVEYDVCLFTVL